MSLITNPFGSSGQSDRLEKIAADRASGAITQGQYDDLISAEGVTSRYLMLKRVGIAALFLTVAFFSFAGA